MPTYEYKCTKCGYHFERFQNISDEPIKECTKCNGKVERLIGAGVILKGSRFYEKDYKKSPSATRCGKDAPCCGRDVPCDKPACND